jgi:lipid-A-disaccharide synthase
MVVVYKESFLNWHVLGRMITTDHYGLVNLVAGKRLATELIQNEFTGDSLAKELLALLDAQPNATIRAELETVARKIGGRGASERAARAILKAISQ